MVKVERKIIGFEVVKPEERTSEQKAPATAPAPLVLAERGEALGGTTYKIKPATQSHALYLTINDSVGDDGVVTPFEIFINSKNMDHFQWIVALTRIMSAVFRKGGDVTFLVEELKAVFDPRGGYFKPGGTYMPSIVAELGLIVEQHLKSIGMIKDSEISEAQRALINEKRAAYEATLKAPGAAHDVGAGEAGGYPAGATLCPKCSTSAVVLMDGCATCLACGYSKCG